MNLTNYEAPRDALLSKYVKIERDGNEAQFVVPDPSTLKYAYGSMMNLRISLIHFSTHFTVTALTIAIRYAITRRQFKSSKKEALETQIIDFQAHQKRLFTSISSTMAFLFFYHKLKTSHLKFMDLIQESKNKEASALIKDLHSLSCAGKAEVTMKSWQIAKQAREACGGNGFLDISGLPALVRLTEAYPVVEGEHYILIQQTGRYLLKVAQDIAKRGPQAKVGESVRYLLNAVEILGYKSSKGTHLTSKDNLIRAFQQRSVYYMQKLIARVETLTQDKESFLKVLSEKLQIEVVRNSTFYIQMYILSTFYTILDNESIIDPKVRGIFKLYCENYALSTILEDIPGFMSTGYFDSEDIENLREIFYQQLKDIRKICLLTMDSFRFQDYELRSVLGCYDGKVYERLFDSIKNQNPLNKIDLTPEILKLTRGRL